MTPDQLDEWLVNALTEHGGTADMSAIVAAAESAGINWRRVQRARERLGVLTQRSGFGEITTVWTLPAGLATTLAATDGSDGRDGGDGTDATVTDGSAEWGSLAPVAAALDLLGSVTDAARGMLVKFAAGRLPRQQVNDLKWTVAAAQRGLDTMARNGITLDSLREMVRAESRAEVTGWFTAEARPVIERVAAGLGFDPRSDDVLAVLGWAIEGDGPQPKIPTRPEPRRVENSGDYRCTIGPPGSPGHGFCARWPECSTDVNGNHMDDSPDCDSPHCKPPRCTSTGDHQHRLDERVFPPGWEPTGWVRRT